MDLEHRPQPAGHEFSSNGKRRRASSFFAALLALLATLALVLAMTPRASADPSDPGQPDPTVSATTNEATPPDDDVTPPIDDATPPADDATPPSDTTPTVTGVPEGTFWQPSATALNQAPSSGGYIPPMIDTTAINDGTYTSTSGLAQAVSLTPTYDLRTAHPTWLSGLRDQGSWGTCWAFAASEAAETSLVRNGVLTGYESATAKQISPLHLVQSVYFTNTYSPLVSDPLAAGGAYQLGGNDFMAAAAWAHWYGAQKEASYPYPVVKTVAPPILSSTQLKSSAYHLLNQLILPAPRTSSGAYSAANVATIKQAVFTYGGVVVAFKGSRLNTAPYYNAATTGFYDPTFAVSDHAVLIIGWDDTFAASKFTSTPPGPGAFLIQNSWGTNTSYFYLSYYDTTMTTSSAFDLISATTSPNYQSPYGWTDEYAYDELGQGTAIKYNTSSSSANKFTARQDTTLRAIQFMAAEPNTTYKLSVYVGAIKSSSPVSGGSAKALTSSGATTISGTLTYAGYNTVTLAKPVIIKQGQKFTIVMTQTNSSKQYLVPVEAKWDNPYYSMNLTISAGQSYMKYGGKWYDLTTVYKSWKSTSFGNANIIALTSPKPTNLLTFNANGGTVSPPNKTVTYNSKLGTLPTPTRNGYSFSGWYTATSGGSKYTSTKVASSIGDQTLYARWKAKTYTAKFSANGGSAPTKSGKKYVSKTVTFDKTYGALPTTKRTGYTFAGWFTGKTDGTLVTSTTPVTTTGTRTLYAHWNPNTYTVKFNPNKGELPLGASTSKPVVYGATYGPMPQPTRDSYLFSGWYTKSSGGTKITETSKVTFTGTRTLYAHWTRIA